MSNFDYDYEGNQLTLDQLNDLKVLAKLADADGSVRKLINSALSNQNDLGRKLSVLPYSLNRVQGLTRTQPKPKFRSLPSKCSTQLLEQTYSKLFNLVNNLEYNVDDDEAIVLKPCSQLGSYVYAATVDYALRIIQSKILDRHYFDELEYDYENSYDIVTLEFTPSILEGIKTFNRYKLVIINGRAFITVSVVSSFNFELSPVLETVDLVLQAYDYETRNERNINNRGVKQISSHSPSGIISTSSMSRGSVIEDDDFER